MTLQRKLGALAAPSPSFVMLLVFFGVLWVAGGASKADALGQVIVRSSAAVVLMAALFSVEWRWRDWPRPVVYLLMSTVALVLLQLLPLPPFLWQALPSRAIFSAAISDGQPWRPLSIQPSATVNAAASLLVPIIVFALMAGLRHVERGFTTALLLGTVAASALIGSLQFSGTLLDNPLINDSPGAVSGMFANRNHFALFLAIGCLCAPVWAFGEGRGASWRGPLVLGLVPLFLLVILATGSRAGLLVGVIALLLGGVLSRRGLRRAMRRFPKWGRIAIGIGVIGSIIAVICLSILADRAQSVDRAVSLDAGLDMRARALPTVFELVGAYFPFGAGFGTFDAAFRIGEPFSLLKLTYFNHAHNDYLEIVLDGGAPAAILLATAILWWLVASFRVWRSESSSDVVTGRLGSAIVLLVLISSIFDYPARVPMIMATVTMASIWLAWGSAART